MDIFIGNEAFMERQTRVIEKYTTYPFRAFSYDTISDMYRGKFGGAGYFHDINSLPTDFKEWILTNLPANTAYIGMGPLCFGPEFGYFWFGGYDSAKNLIYETSSFMITSPLKENYIEIQAEEIAAKIAAKRAAAETVAAADKVES